MPSKTGHSVMFETTDVHESENIFNINKVESLPLAFVVVSGAGAAVGASVCSADVIVTIAVKLSFLIHIASVFKRTLVKS